MGITGLEAAGKGLAFLPARCFFGLFGERLCASCSVDCGLFCGVGGRRFVAGVGGGLGLVVGGFVLVSVMVAGRLLQSCMGAVPGAQLALVVRCGGLGWG